MTNTEDKSLPKWRKISGGALYLGPKSKRRVKPKEIIWAHESELERCMPDNTGVYHFELLEDGTGKNKVTKKSNEVEEITEKDIPKKETYEVEQAGIGWYNIVSSARKVMNEKKLRADDAADLKDKLEADSEVE